MDYAADTLAGGFNITPGCTLAFVATNPNFGNVAVTASHCSPTLWSQDTNTVFQPWNSSNAIGHEVQDPWPGTCPLLWACNRYRYSDADMIGLNSGVIIRKGFLARPEDRTTGHAGSTLIDGSNPWLTVTGGNTAGVISGEMMDHIGRTTG